MKKQKRVWVYEILKNGQKKYTDHPKENIHNVLAVNKNVRKAKWYDIRYLSDFFKEAIIINKKLNWWNGWLTKGIVLAMIAILGWLVQQYIQERLQEEKKPNLEQRSH